MRSFTRLERQPMRLRRGMTLIELIVALAITGLALGSGYSAYATLADRHMAESERADAIVRTAAIRGAMVSWLSGARLTIEEDDIAFRAISGVRRTPNGDAPDADLTFLTSSPTPVSANGTIVHLWVSNDTSSERGLIAELAEWRGHHHLVLPLDSSIGGLEVAIRSSARGTDPWVPSWVSSTVLPAGLRLTLTPLPGDSLAPLLRLPITVSLENGR